MFDVECVRRGQRDVVGMPGARQQMGPIAGVAGSQEPAEDRRQTPKVNLTQHVKEVVLTPAKKDGDDVYEVSGSESKL